MSQRRACRLVDFSRSAAWYRRGGRNDGALRERLKELAQEYPRYGCPTLHDMLVIEGRVVNFKRTYRLYREEGLQVRRKRRKKLNIPRIPMIVPSAVNERWSVDFVSDQLANGRRFRVFNVVDDFSRECVLQIVDFSISGQRLVNELDRLSRTRRLPNTIVCDNGPELTSKAMFLCSQRVGVKLHFIQPGKADAELVRRELQRQVPRVLPRLALVHEPGGCAVTHRALARALQPRQAASIARQETARAVRSERRLCRRRERCHCGRSARIRKTAS